jgi:tetratricopeptide (TPR) repeat protein
MAGEPTEDEEDLEEHELLEDFDEDSIADLSVADIEVLDPGNRVHTAPPPPPKKGSENGPTTSAKAASIPPPAPSRPLGRRSRPPKSPSTPGLDATIPRPAPLPTEPTRMVSMPAEPTRAASMPAPVPISAEPRPVEPMRPVERPRGPSSPGVVAAPRVEPLASTEAVPRAPATARAPETRPKTPPPASVPPPAIATRVKGTKALREARERLASEPPPREMRAQPTPRSDAEVLVRRCLTELAKKPDPTRAARLHYEIARLYEGPLADVRAADEYIKAAQAAPDHVPSIRGARRALIAQNKLKNALPFFDAEVRTTGDPARKARLLLEKGRLFERLGDRAGALGAYRQGVELSPADASLLKSIERCERAAEAWDDLSRTYERFANTLGADERWRAAVIAEQAMLEEARKNDLGGAAELYSRALAIDPIAPGALASLKRLRREGKKWGDLVSALGQEFQLAEDAGARASALHRSARLLRDHLGDVPKAIASLERALVEQPADRAMRRELAELFRATSQPELYATALAELAESAALPAEQVALCHRIGQVCEMDLRDLERARAWYERALEIDGAHRPSLGALERIYEELGEHEALVQILIGEARAASDPLRKAAAHARVATILETKIGDVEQAALQHEAALGLAPGHEPSFKALQRLYTQAGRFRDLVEILRRAVDEAPDVPRAVAYLFRIGAIQEDHLGDYEGALHAYRRILSLVPADLGAIHASARAAERAARYPELVAALDEELKLVEGNPKRRAAILFRTAEVLLDQLDDADRATRRLETVLKIEPANRSALAMLARIHAAAGRYEELLAVNRRVLEVETDRAERVALLHKMGELCETRLGREEDATTYYRNALELEPAHPQSFEALRTILEKRRAYPDLARLLESQLEKAESDRERARLAAEVGELYEDRINKDDRALVFYERALEIDPTHRGALDARARLLIKRRDWQGLASSLEEEREAMSTVEAKVDALVREGAVWAYRLNDPDRAIAAYRGVLDLKPGHIGALLAIEEQALKKNDTETLAVVYGELAERARDPNARLAALRELERVLVARGNEAGAQEARRLVVELAPHDDETLEALSRSSDIDARLAYESQLAGVRADPGLSAAHQLTIAEMLEAEDPAQALGAYRAALAMDGESLVAARGLSRVARVLADPAALREAALREAKTTGDVPLATELLIEAAELNRQRRALTEAAADLDKALELAPEHPHAAELLTRVVLELGDVARLIETLTRTADSAAPLDRKAQLHVAIAELQVEKLANIPAAIASLGRALKAQPDSVPALALLASCLELSERWTEAVETLKKLVRHAKDPAALVDAHLSLAALCDDKVNDPREARTSLRFVLDRDPQNAEALARLGRLSAREGRRDEAAELAKRLVDAAQTPEERADALVEMAGIEEARGDTSAAAAALLDAITIQGPSGAAAPRYAALVEGRSRGANWDDYLGALLRHRDVARRLGLSLTALYLELAHTFGTRLSRPDRELALLKEGTDENPADVALAIALGRHFRGARAYAKAVAELRRALEHDPRDPEIWRELAASFEEMGERDESVAALSGLAVLDAAGTEEMLAVRGRPARAGEARPGLLGDAGFREVHVDGCHDSPAARLVVALSETTKKLFAGDPTRYGVSKRERLAARSEHPVRAVADRVAHIFGVPDFDLYIHGTGGRDVRVELTSPPTLMVPEPLADLPRPELVFVLAKALAHVGRDMGVFAQIPLADIPPLLIAGVQSVVPEFSARSPVDVEALAARVQKATPRRSKRPLEEAASYYAASPPVDPAAWARAIEQTSYRAALLVTDDLPASMRAIGRIVPDSTERDAITGDLMRFWISDTAHRFRRAM